MLSHLLIIMLELGVGFSIPIPSMLLYFQDRFNRIYKIFTLISFSFAFSLILDSLNRLLLHLSIPVDDYLFRFSDSFLILAGITLVYHGLAFPRRMHFVKKNNSDTWASRNPAGFWGLILTGSILCLFSFSSFYMKDGLFNPLTGVYVAKTGPVFFAIRIFFIFCLLYSIKFQYKFHENTQTDPRKLHSRYYIYANFFLMIVFLIVEIAKKITWIENELMALWSATCFIFIIFLYNIFANIGISYKSGIKRGGLYLSVYILLLSPFVVLTYKLVSLSEKFPVWLVVSLTSLLFLGFQYLASGIFPLIRKHFFKKNKQQIDAISTYNSKIQELGTENFTDIHHKLLTFMNQNFKSKFICFYFINPNEVSLETKKENEPIFIRDPYTSQNILSKKDAPESLPPEIFQLLFHIQKQGQNGGLIVDLLYKIERLGLTDWAQKLVELSACGAELILPLFQFEDLQSKGFDILNQTPFGILITGELESGNSFDTDDLSVLQLLVTPTVLAFKNNNLLNSAVQFKEKLEEENKKMSWQLSSDINPNDKIQNKGFLFSQNSIMEELVSKAQRFSTNDSPLLITGETGTGKSHLADFIHKNSLRKGKMVTINCSAIPVDLIENELFGHEKGAYTGATESKAGLVERAQDGSLFMDEVGELAIESQTKLLRLLQNGEYERIGSSQTIVTNTRFIFATNKDLEQEIQNGKFRLDLYYRISTFELDLPPLRKRKSDKPLLIHSLLEQISTKLNKVGIKLSDEAMEQLIEYNYPGNIRELENILFRATVLNDTGTITAKHLPIMFTNRLKFKDKKMKVSRLNNEINNLEKEMLIEALELKSGNQREAAELLEISRGSLQYKIKQFNIKN